MTYTECKTVTLVTRSGGRMTTVYLNGEGQRVAVVEERLGNDAANPWATMTPEAGTPGRGGEASQATDMRGARAVSRQSTGELSCIIDLVRA